MSLPVVIRPDAENDLQAAFGWYERQQIGLGRRFIDQVSASFDNMAEQPRMYALVWEDVRSCRLRVFPYLIYYRVLDNRLEVLAVLHGSRHPTTWRDRI